MSTQDVVRDCLGAVEEGLWWEVEGGLYSAAKGFRGWVVVGLRQGMGRRKTVHSAQEQDIFSFNCSHTLCWLRSCRFSTRRYASVAHMGCNNSIPDEMHTKHGGWLCPHHFNKLFLSISLMFDSWFRDGVTPTGITPKT